MTPMRFVVCDDAVPPELADTAVAAFLSPEFPWHCFPNVNHLTPPLADRPGAFGPDPRFADSLLAV